MPLKISLLRRHVHCLQHRHQVPPRKVTHVTSAHGVILKQPSGKARRAQENVVSHCGDRCPLEAWGALHSERRMEADQQTLPKSKYGKSELGCSWTLGYLVHFLRFQKSVMSKFL